MVFHANQYRKRKGYDDAQTTIATHILTDPYICIQHLPKLTTPRGAKTVVQRCAKFRQFIWLKGAKNVTHLANENAAWRGLEITSFSKRERRGFSGRPFWWGWGPPRMCSCYIYNRLRVQNPVWFLVLNIQLVLLCLQGHAATAT